MAKESLLSISRDAVRTSFVPSLYFDTENGLVTIEMMHAPPVHLSTALTFKLTRPEARKLAAALTAWVKAK